MTERELSRRRFLQMVGLASAAALEHVGAHAGPRLLSQYDDGSAEIPGPVMGDPGRVIVVGAGFAGLAIANALANAGIECVVLEGRDRVGGRAWTADVGAAPVDLGCSWITDPVGNPMTRFATQSKVLQTNAAIEADVPSSRFYDARTGLVLPHDTMQAVAQTLLFEESSPSISRKLGPSASMRDGIRYYLDSRKLAGDSRRFAEYFMRLITELPDATDWEKDSLEYWSSYESPYFGFGEGNFPRGGYTRLVASLGGGADVRLGHRATDVIDEGDGVRVRTTVGDTPVEFAGTHVVITAPLGVLKAGDISFTPPLPASKNGAIQRLGFGTFEKIVMRFPDPFWAGQHSHVFYLSDTERLHFPLIVDYFWLQQVPILVAFNVGTYALELDTLSDDGVSERMLDVLRAVRAPFPVPDPTEVVVTRWGGDPFSHGSYSFIPVGASPADQEELAKPAGRVLFAGEASSAARFGYADGALSTGIREAKRLLQRASVTLRAHT